MMERPNLDRLVDAALAMALAIGYRQPDRAQTARLLDELLYKSQQEGGRELWGCFIDRLITQTELMARLSTEFSHRDGIAEPTSTQRLSGELERAFETALFGAGILGKLVERAHPGAEPSSTPSELDNWIACIRDSDPMMYEGAYHGPRPSGPDVVPRLIQELHASASGYARGKFLELLGEMGDQSVVPVLIAELAHSDANVREWAVTALTKLDSPDGARAVRAYREAHPDD